MTPNRTQLFWMYLGIRQYLATDNVGREVVESMIGTLEDDTHTDVDDCRSCMDTIREALFRNDARDADDLEQLLEEFAERLPDVEPEALK